MSRQYSIRQVETKKSESPIKVPTETAESVREQIIEETPPIEIPAEEYDQVLEEDSYGETEQTYEAPMVNKLFFFQTTKEAIKKPFQKQKRVF